MSPALGATGIARRVSNIATTGHVHTQPWQQQQEKRRGTFSSGATRPSLHLQQTYDQQQQLDTYDIGDIYDDEQIKRLRLDWEIDMTDYPYLRNVKSLSNTWPHLGLLANFMEVTTTPIRWKDLRGPANAASRAERAARTNIARLDYYADGSVISRPITTPSALREALSEHESETARRYQAFSSRADEAENEKEATEESTIEVIDHHDHPSQEQPKADTTASKQCTFRLYVVEDLSRDVIELLGSHLDIDPCFFREHIVDYAWFNTRDRWLNPPMLDLVTRRQDWFSMRYVSARYHKTEAEYLRSRDEAQDWNVLRRPDDDLNNKAYWDAVDAKVAIARTKTGFWSRRPEPGKEQIAVLLVDPTIKAGHTLWYGVRNWEPIPSFQQDYTPAGPPRTSFFDDFVYWAQRTPYPDMQSKTDASQRSSGSSGTIASTRSSNQPNTAFNPVARPIQALLHMVGSEWLTMSDYIKTRLTQIDWEISFPEQFIRKDVDIDSALKKLHVWRRLVPLYREMLEETIHHVFLYPAPMLPQLHCSMTDDCECAAHALTSNGTGAIASFHGDYKRVLGYMEEHQSRVDRLTSVVTAVMSITDSRHSMAENRNVASLTWLATFFVPMSFVTGLYSMSSDITQNKKTFEYYFATAIPLSVLALGIVWAVTHRHEAYFGIVPEKKPREVPKKYK